MICFVIMHNMTIFFSFCYISSVPFPSYFVSTVRLTILYILFLIKYLINNQVKHIEWTQFRYQFIVKFKIIYDDYFYIRLFLILKIWHVISCLQLIFFFKFKNLSMKFDIRNVNLNEHYTNIIKLYIAIQNNRNGSKSFLSLCSICVT